MQAQQQPTAASPSPSPAAEPKLVAIPPGHIQAIWPLIEPLLLRVVERSDGRYSMRGMAQRLVSGDWVLRVVWVDGEVRAIVGAEVYSDVSGMRCCIVRFCTGHGAKDWSHLLVEIEDWARKDGCERIEMIARKGWAKHLKDYALTHVFLEKQL